jgi:hypothetical protein
MREALNYKELCLDTCHKGGEGLPLRDFRICSLQKFKNAQTEHQLDAHREISHS